MSDIGTYLNNSLWFSIEEHCVLRPEIKGYYCESYFNSSSTNYWLSRTAIQKIVELFSIWIKFLLSHRSPWNINERWLRSHRTSDELSHFHSRNEKTERNSKNLAFYRVDMQLLSRSFRISCHQAIVGGRAVIKWLTCVHANTHYPFAVSNLFLVNCQLYKNCSYSKVKNCLHWNETKLTSLFKQNKKQLQSFTESFKGVNLNFF